MRRPVIAGNWKMYKLSGESVAVALDLKSMVSNVNHCDIVIAPVYTSLKSVADRLEGSNIRVAAQDLSSEIKQGAHTGEICGDMLRDAGCTHVIIGHSERRSLYGETDSSVNRKIRAALHFRLTAIVCVGETLEERDQGVAQQVVGRQLAEGLSGLTVDELQNLVIAYEPVWAIGTGRTASPQQAQEMHAFVRSYLEQNFGGAAAQSLRILYGGSVKPENISELMQEKDIDGALVGGASLDAQSFARIINYER